MFLCSQLTHTSILNFSAVPCKCNELNSKKDKCYYGNCLIERSDNIYSNKDHQRMVVDPMFIIVQSLRSFLTAVTTTVVAPIAFILPVFT